MHTLWLMLISCNHVYVEELSVMFLFKLLRDFRLHVMKGKNKKMEPIKYKYKSWAKSWFLYILIHFRIKLCGTVIKILILIYFIILVAELYLYGTENTYIDYSSAIYN